MSKGYDPESIDLAEVVRMLRTTCGQRVEGAIVGRTRLRDEVVRELGCSQLEGEQLIDTMVSLGYLTQRRLPVGPIEWIVGDQ